MSDPEKRDPERPTVALIAGPTAGGKSAVALRLAERHGGVIINADASQVYADLAVITARPPREELARAPHRLFGHVDGAEDYSAARWAAEARIEIDAAHKQGKPAILVGGTGLYLDTLLQGIAPVPEIDPAIREAVRALPVAQTHALLATEDPEAAARLRPSDTSRVARALEVIRSTGTPIAQWQARREGGIAGLMPIRAAVIMLPRDVLAERAAQRLTQMLAGGALEEVGALLARDLPVDRPVLRAIGVPELRDVIAGRLTLQEAQAAILAATRAYQKRQITWGRNRQRHWIKTEPDALAGLADLPAIP
ncbi:tRNA (adenosine(37)-N6)-dimethylallyltransferase MiaA [Sphingobium nicotianae]|uniref:tRNA dimethylallyltransferase n=1 Tax=Sphingobium nicotianae TaxID=2782607 RepID=A0A9X1D9D7_9SPHN|nr:tRNA (adenosine(37)-N6)-dimethylallyltransferase MiaA [Sphingobium nicotianae]MBT2185703.1 tRNA (adenosine(37)-N6)-dimethylallyltransferase MiaA [Sphingobium nicotianae]